MESLTGCAEHGGYLLRGEAEVLNREDPALCFAPATQGEESVSPGIWHSIRTKVPYRQRGGFC